MWRWKRVGNQVVVYRKGLAIAFLSVKMAQGIREDYAAWICNQMNADQMPKLLPNGTSNVGI